MSRITSGAAVAAAALVLLAALPVQAGLPDPVAPVVNGEFEISAEAARPATCALLGEGYINVFEPGNFLGLPWLASVNGCHAGALKALHWSSPMSTEFADWDGDGDREAKFIPGIPDPSLGSSHNLWQAYPSPHQAYVANFAELTFRVEQGSTPAGATVILSLSNTPLSDPSPWVGLFFMCQISFRIPAGTSGAVALDPAVDATFQSRDPSCNADKAAWDAATTPDERREILDKLRIVQHSYWNFINASDPVVLDGVAIVGGRTVAEALVDQVVGL